MIRSPILRLAVALAASATLTAGGGCAQETSQAAPPAAAEAAAAPPTIYDAVIVNRYPHDTDAFTQGLFFAGGALHESTGQYGQSTIRRLNMQTGAALAVAALPDEIFGEGAVAIGDRIISLSWRAGRGFIHDLKTLERIGAFEFAGEGWGLTYDGDRLILSDGTDRLRFLDPESFAETGSLAVTLNGRPVMRINELEWIEGEVWANIWMEDAIIRIDPKTGRVTGVIDVSHLFPVALRANPRDDVPNGIAYEPTSRRLFLTGKRWPQLFEVRLQPRN